MGITQPTSVDLLHSYSSKAMPCHTLSISNKHAGLGSLADITWKLYPSIKQPATIYSHLNIHHVRGKLHSVLGNVRLSGGLASDYKVFATKQPGQHCSLYTSQFFNY